MAEALEQGGDAGQAGVDSVYACEDCVEFVGDAFLLGQWCDWYLNRLKMVTLQVVDIGGFKYEAQQR